MTASPRKRHRQAASGRKGTSAPRTPALSLPVRRHAASELKLSPRSLSGLVLDVIDELTRAGYQAYLVGGCVRDMLLGRQPKDFDAVTNATPQQIKQVFGRRCRIIGKRFELAHVFSGRELIEVATFRAPPPPHQLSTGGMITRDNVWGTIEQDFVRRDFTVNALYYQPRDGVILDFCDGLQHLRARRLELLGIPETRFEEDPVRLLRTIRFAAKLDFTIDERVEQAIRPSLINLLYDVSPHRLYDELQKLFVTGHLLTTLDLLITHQLWPVLFEQIDPVISPLVEAAARNTDNRLAQGKTVNPAFFLAILLWDNYQQQVRAFQKQGLNLFDALTQAATRVLVQQSKRTAIPQFAMQFIRETWELQWRLHEPKARQIPNLIQQPRFRAGFDFLQLREKIGEPTDGMARWWDRYQTLTSNDQREAMIRDLNRQQQRQRRGDPAAEPSIATQPDQAGRLTPEPVPDPAPTGRPGRRKRQASDLPATPPQDSLPENVDQIDADELPPMPDPILQQRPPRELPVARRRHRAINGLYQRTT